MIYELENTDGFAYNLGRVKGKNLPERFAKVINFGYDLAIKQNYDYVIIVGADVMLPNVGVTYMLEAFEDIPEAGMICLHCCYRSPELGPFPMMVPLFEKGKVESTEYFAHKYYEVMAGNGAMMVPRKVFSKLPWRETGYDKPTHLGRKWGGDYQYCIDVREKLGLKVIIRTDIETGHMEEDGKTMCHSGMEVD